MLSVHTCPLATLGGKQTGGMNVYVRNLAHEFVRRGIQVDIFTRYQGICDPRVEHELGHGGRVIHIPAGPPAFLPTIEHLELLPQFTQSVLEFATREEMCSAIAWGR